MDGLKQAIAKKMFGKPKKGKKKKFDPSDELVKANLSAKK